MELLTETIDVGRSDETNVVNSTNAVDKDLLKEKPLPGHFKSKRLKDSFHRGVRSIDPLFYTTLILSMMILAAGLFAVHRYNEKLVDGYMVELHAANEEYKQRIAAGSEAVIENSVPSGSLSDDILPQVKAEEDPVVQPQAAVADAVSGAELLLADPDALDPDALAGEVDALKQLLQDKTQQIEFLALENHELRLQAEFGDHDIETPVTDLVINDDLKNTQADVSIVPLDDFLLSEVTPLPEAIRSPDAASLSDVVAPKNTASGADLQRFIANGFEAYTVQNLPAASEWYNQALQIDPYNRDANVGVAATATARGKYQLALDRYRHLLSIDPDDQLAFSEMLKLATAENMIETELLSHIATSNKPAPLYSIAGHYFGLQGRWSQARNMYEQALASTSNLPPADYFFNLAVSYEHIGLPAKAAEHYLQAINSPRGATFERETAVRQLEMLAATLAK